MEICYHTIDENEVIGIGPLMVNMSSDINVRMMLNRKQLSFELHLRGHTTDVKSDWLDLGRDPVENCSEAEKESRKLYEKFRTMHKTATDTIRELIASRQRFEA